MYFSSGNRIILALVISTWLLSVATAFLQIPYMDYACQGRNPKIMDAKENSSKTSKGSREFNVDGPMTVEESMELLGLSLARNFQNGHNQYELEERILWKRRVLDLMATILQRSCSPAYVPAGYVNIIKELYYFYSDQLLKKETRIGRNYTGSQAEWKGVIQGLEKCCANAKAKPLRLKGSREITEMLTGHGRTLQIPPYADPSDKAYTWKDDVLDGIWWIFAYSYAYCYNHLLDRNKNSTILTYLIRDQFNQDFLSGFGKRCQPFQFNAINNGLGIFWKNAGEYSHAFGTIFGSYNNSLCERNLRACVTAGYRLNGVGVVLQVDRPVPTP